MSTIWIKCISSVKLITPECYMEHLRAAPYGATHQKGHMGHICICNRFSVMRGVFNMHWEEISREGWKCKDQYFFFCLLEECNYEGVKTTARVSPTSNESHFSSDSCKPQERRHLTSCLTSLENSLTSNSKLPMLTWLQCILIPH